MKDKLETQVQAITDHLNVIRSLLRRSGLADMAGSSLTPQQIIVLKELSLQDGLTLKQLSARMALAHSTVSGIVDRLEQKNLVHRRPDPQDRRYSRIYRSEIVAEYLRYHAPSQRTNLLVGALQRAQPSERKLILKGLAALQRLLEDEQKGERDDEH